MALTAGSRLGPYEVVGAIGTGGMGEVYRARDRKLQREVAIKVLPASFAADPDRLARFEREAQVLASLNHPHIAHVYGLEESGGVRALVMELVDGETLAEKLAHGRLPLEESRTIARQIAEALEAAHDRGIIHRDLKPANVKVAADGAVKVLDFGLAKALDPSGAVDAMNSPTLTSPALMTRAGVILGTAAYMAPEQAAGKPVDRRADIWAFGCVLFQMLTGRAPFAGDTVTETLAAVLRDAPPLDALPPDTPAAVKRLLARCLERDPKRRLRDIGDARLELDTASEPVPATARPGLNRRTILVPALLLVALSVMLTAATVWRLKPDRVLPLRKLELGADLGIKPATAPELSPDGSRVAYLSGDNLWVRDLDRLVPRDLGAVPADPYRLGWSPDGAWLAVASRDGKIRRVAVGGGPPLVVCDVPESRVILGLAWLGDEMVLAAWRGGLYRVDSRSGVPRLWLAIDPRTEIDFHALAALPDGRVMFATHRRTNENPIEVFDGVSRSLLLPATLVGALAYAPTGHLLFVRADPNPGLWALPFKGAPLDPSRAFLVSADANYVSVGRDGSLLLVASGERGESFELTATNRAGTESRAIGEPAAYVVNPQVSPDGKRIVLVRGARSQADVWAHDLSGTGGTRVTFQESDLALSGWFPAGDRILLTEHLNRIEGSEVSAVAVDGSGRRQSVVKALSAVVSPDGKNVVYMVDDRGPGRLRHAELGPDGAAGPPRKIFTTDPEPNVREFSLSPDGRLLAYIELGSSGKAELFLTPYGTGEGKWQILAPNIYWQSGGQVLRWARDTNELFFAVEADQPRRLRLTSVAIGKGLPVAIGPSKGLFEADTGEVSGGFDVAPDGQTVFMARRKAGQAGKAQARYVVVQNWLAEFTNR